MCGRPGTTMEEQFKELRDMLGPLMRSVTNFESHVQTISNSVVLLTSRITNVEQIVSALSAMMVAFETGAAPAFSGVWPLPGRSGGSTATGSCDPIPMDENENTRRKLDTDSGPDDKKCTKRRSLTVQKLSAWPTYFLQDQNVKVLWQDSRMATNRIQSPGLNCLAKSRILVRQSRSPEWREIGRRLVPLWNLC